MKASSATSAKATGRQQRTGRSSARPSLTSAKGFALTGPSHPPDARYHAYRPDLADCALAHQVIASHYAEPLERLLTCPATLRAAPSDEAEALLELKPGDLFSMLDNSLGWAWGYAGKQRRVGYVRAETVGPA
ncbi:MAG: hypothetical protein ABI422_07265 [Sphingomicrobium sp.]